MNVVHHDNKMQCESYHVYVPFHNPEGFSICGKRCDDVKYTQRPRY